MLSAFKPICPGNAVQVLRAHPLRCTVCSTSTRIARCTETTALGISGVPVYYHRCPECQFIFTTALDQFSKEDFARHVYNDQYSLIDPDYQDARPRHNAALVKELLSQAPRARIS